MVRSAELENQIEKAYALTPTLRKPHLKDRFGEIKMSESFPTERDDPFERMLCDAEVTVFRNEEMRKRRARIVKGGGGIFLIVTR